MRKGSGKQILNKIFYELSRKIVPLSEMDEASERVRTGLLLLGSTAEESFALVDKIKWSSDYYEEHEEEEEEEDDDEDSSVLSQQVSRQGIATVNDGIFISDIFEDLWCDKVIEDRFFELYPQFDKVDYEAVFKTMWLVLISVQMFEQMLSVETDEDLDLDEWVKGYKKKMNWYRRERKSKD